MTHRSILPPSFNPKRNRLDLVRTPGHYHEVAVDPYLKLLYDETEFKRIGHEAVLHGVRFSGWMYLDRTLRGLRNLDASAPLPAKLVLELSIVGAYATIDTRKGFEDAQALYAKAKDFVGDLEIAIPL